MELTTALKKKYSAHIGADVMYPPDNEKLADRLAESGCIVTEYCLGTPPLPGNFPRRNRLISGLARGVLVVEAARGSGSLITARLALDQNREVFAVPGSIHNTKARGCHALLRDGAKLVENAADVLVELSLPATMPALLAKPVAGIADPLLDAMGDDPVSLDQIIVRSGLSAQDCAARIALLEIDGSVAAMDGGLFQRLIGRQ